MQKFRMGDSSRTRRMTLRLYTLCATPGMTKDAEEQRFIKP